MCIQRALLCDSESRARSITRTYRGAPRDLPCPPCSRLQLRSDPVSPSPGMGSPEHCSCRVDHLQEMIMDLHWGRGCPRGLDSTLSKAYLEDGVVSLLAGPMPCGVAPGDIEEFPFPIDPLKSWVLAAVHLGHQPGLQPHTAGWWGNPRGWLVHGKGLCRRKHSRPQQIHTRCSLKAVGGALRIWLSAG